jgi:hypothetical protein
MTVRDRSQAILQHMLPVTLIDSGGVARTFPAYKADLWLHPFQSRTNRIPLRLSLSGGFVLCPTLQDNTEDGPPLPLVGSLALHDAGLKLIVDYEKLDFCIQQG